MLVETFECTETTEEESLEAIELINKLGLEGQKVRINKDSRFPFREMLKDEYHIYKILCPNVEKLENYNRSPIPLRVLEIIELTLRFPDMFDHIEIWDKASSEIKDPVVVAVSSATKESSWAEKHYLLARWGEELDSWVTLKEVAKDKALTEMRTTLTKIKSLVNMHLENINDMSLESLNKDISIYGLDSL